jgi:predicted nucleic acid-binding protein
MKKHCVNVFVLFGVVLAMARSFVWIQVGGNRPWTAREYAIAISRSKKLLLPDALIAATALSLNATVISNDPHLRDFQWPGYSARPW